MTDPGFADLTGFGPQVDITCDDAGTNFMVGLLVTDMGGNTNMCMASVSVKDKVDARMVVPGPMTVDCGFAFDPANPAAFFGEIEVLDNCPAANTIQDDMVGELTTCGTGTLTRELRLFSPQGDLLEFKTQEITFASGDPLTYSDITPPTSELEFDGCGIEAINALDVNIPIVPQGICQQTSIAVESDTFPFTQSDGACLKILRTFSVIDWCITDGPGSIFDPWQFTQVIKVNNTEAPFFTEVFEARVDTSYALDCGGSLVSGLTATSDDLCTASNEVSRTYEVIDANGTVIRSGAGHDASGAYDLGEYTVRFTAEDRCGNQTVRESTFAVINGKRPTPYCFDGLSTSLVMMDPDNDGESEPMVMLGTSFFDAGSYHPCGLEVQVSFSSDVTDQVKVFDCSDVGAQTVELWVTDSNGNQDFCTSTVDIQDNDGLCSQSECIVGDYTGWTVATCNAEAGTGGRVGILYDTRATTTAPAGVDWSPSIDHIAPANWTIDEIGQVFGIATDGSANVYLASSDVYDTQFDSDPFGPATIFKASPNNGFTAVEWATLPNTGGALNGIGNIVYDDATGHLYASNLEDGMIYSLDASGNIVDTYDPWTADTGAAGIVTSSEQVWGIGINDEGASKKLYFARISAGERANCCTDYKECQRMVMKRQISRRTYLSILMEYMTSISLTKKEILEM